MTYYFDQEYGNYLPCDPIEGCFQVEEIHVDSKVLGFMITDLFSVIDHDDNFDLSEIKDMVIDFNKKLAGTPEDELLGTIVITEGVLNKGHFFDSKRHEFAIGSWATTEELIAEI